MMEENREQERKEQQGPGADGRDDDALKGSAGEYVERKRWLFFGLPFTFTKYTINEQVVTINAGLFSTTENDCYLYKIQDVELRTSLAERIFGLGTVACYTGDNTHPQLASEDARRKRRTLNTLNINADDIDDMD